MALVCCATNCAFVAADGIDETHAAGPTTQSTNTAPAPLAERIAAIGTAHREREKQFHDELRAISKERKQLSEAEYGKRVSEANRQYNEYLRPAADELIAHIKANRTDPDVLEGIILLNGEMSHSLNVDPQLAEIVLEDQITNPSPSA